MQLEPFYPGNNLAYNCQSYPSGPQIPAFIQCPLKNGNFGSGYKPFFQCIAENGANKADDSQCITSDNINYSCHTPTWTKPPSKTKE
jgi:hypothetical protein